MFLADLKQTEKELFIILAQQVIEADGKVEAEEQQLMDLYLHEMNMEGVDIAARSLAELLPELSEKGKKHIYAELMALALVDKSYPNEEKELIENFRREFAISEEESERIFSWLQRYMEICDEGWLLLS